MTAPLIPIVCVVGATATGKTSAAITLCERIDGEIVGVDSVQVYRGVDVGSGKPRQDQLRGIRHHLLDVVNPDEGIDAARYAELADAAIQDIHARGRVPVVVGGTGLWLRALLRGLVEVPPVDADLRARLEQRWETEGAAAMHGYLHRVDPLSATRVHPNDKLRVVRALEVYEQSGHAMGEKRREHALGSPRYHALTYLLQVPVVHLAERQRQRIGEMLGSGWVEETRALLGRYGPSARPLSAVGYRQLVTHLNDGVPLDETRSLIERVTRLYARRQTTWFKSDRDVDHVITPDALLGDTQLGTVRRHLGR